MALQYIVPRVAIDESDVGPRPTPGISLATIGVVGTFTKGPVNKPTIVGGIDQLINRFGPLATKYTGPLSMTGALNQGATDYVVTRIVGNGAAKASLVLKDNAATPKDSIIAEASSEGEWANGDTSDIGIKVAVATGTAADTVKLIVIIGSKSWTYDNITLDNLDTIKHEDVTFRKAEGATALPAPISATPLTGGQDGTTSDSDYIGSIDTNGNRTGLKALEPEHCNIVIAAQQTSAAVQAALLTHFANADLDDGLRIGVLNAKKGEAPQAVIDSASSLDSMRGIYAYPWVEPMEIAGTYVAPDGYIAGRLATLPAHHSPSNKQIAGILSTERQLTMAELQALTTGRIMPITPVRGRGFRIRNGVTLSSDPAWNQVNIRRIFDKIEMQVYESTQWAVSEPILPSLWDAIANQIDMMLSIMKRDGEIFDYKPTICNETNNPPEVVQARRLNTIIRVRPVYAADFIDHRIQRLLGNEAG
ncbi:phage tail sheath subtilisin-like domain-containing protein [Aneurinibacillus thermoaerophilus]|uniref:phage tail sheath subtilisin-like domain-containing protein n=1 Tax=Aneurinibacillus thermoaerophilus TaxID=143495 RepID=UPI002E1EFB18|nr:phage tail sheath subtilisin-like domain-containing protein [Aneurinibacillus thermoaerophilus]